MGLEVAKALSKRGGWKIHLLDLHQTRGREAEAQVEGATFYETNVLDYNSLAHVFHTVWETDGRLDFVFANAGIVERFNFYDVHPAGKPPPPPDQTVIDINTKAVINTTWLAQHYFRQSTQSTNKNLIMTASVGGLYACPVSPSYCASKHAVVGLVRSIAGRFWKHDGIRVNAICPGTVKTNLLDPVAWSTFPDAIFVPLEKISSTVLMLIDGHDSGGKVTRNGEALRTGREKLWGNTVELSGENHYYRYQVDYSDDAMETCMVATDREKYNE